VRVADIKIGQIVAVSRGLAAKHLNILDDEEADLELAESGRISGFGALLLLEGGRRGWLAVRLRGGPLGDGQLFAPPYRATVREVGLPWGGKKAGVLVEIETPENLAGSLQMLGIEAVTAVVPSSMLEDYWDAIAQVEAAKQAFLASLEQITRQAEMILDEEAGQ
jgi:hypothetical protein